MSDFHRPRRIEDQYRYALDNLMRSWLHLPRTPDLDSILAYLNNGGGVAVTEAAQRVARGMVTALAVQNAQSWREAAGKSTQGKRIFDLLRTEMDGPVGIVMRGMVAHHALLIRTMPQNIAQDIASQIATRQMRGERAETIAASIYERIPEITASRIAMLARTEVGSTATAISRARSENLGLPCYEWLSSEDVRVRPSHRKMDHVLVLWSDPPAPEMLAHVKSRLGHYHAGMSPNCFTGDTRVSLANGCRKLWRMQYTGDMITIAVRGASFRVTPNHPILTIDGWKPAYLLNIGDHLIQTWNDALSRLESDENNLHPSFQELFEANSPLIEVLSPLGFDFHGDRPKGDVEQISFADDLGMRVEMPRSESEKQFPFSIPYSGIRCTGQSIGTHVSSSLRSPSGEPFSASFNGGSSHSPDHDLAFSTQTDTMLAKSFDDGKTVNPKGFGDTDRCFSGLIPSGDLVNGEQDKIVGSKPFMRDWDALLPEPLAEYVRGNADLLRNSAESHLPYKLRRIVDKAVSSFSGHVYTLQSDNGWYCVTSASIISQNCRCDANVIVDLDQVDWPHKCYSRGSITRMGRARFLKLIHA